MKTSKKAQDTDFAYGLLMVGESKENPFPYNLEQIRRYLKDTGKTLKDVSYNELLPFAIKGRIAVNP